MDKTYIEKLFDNKAFGKRKIAEKLRYLRQGAKPGVPACGGQAQGTPATDKFNASNKSVYSYALG
jgi:hypothetical protein